MTSVSCVTSPPEGRGPCAAPLPVSEGRSDHPSPSLSSLNAKYAHAFFCAAVFPFRSAWQFRGARVTSAASAVAYNECRIFSRDRFRPWENALDVGRKLNNLLPEIMNGGSSYRNFARKWIRGRHCGRPFLSHRRRRRRFEPSRVASYLISDSHEEEENRFSLGVPLADSAGLEFSSFHG